MIKNCIKLRTIFSYALPFLFSFLIIDCSNQEQSGSVREKTSHAKATRLSHDNVSHEDTQSFVDTNTDSNDGSSLQKDGADQNVCEAAPAAKGNALAKLPLDSKALGALDKFLLPQCHSSTDDESQSVFTMYDKNYTKITDKFFLSILKDGAAPKDKNPYSMVIHYDYSTASHPWILTETTEQSVFVTTPHFIDNLQVQPNYFFASIRAQDGLIAVAWIDKDGKLLFKKQSAINQWSTENMEVDPKVLKVALSLTKDCEIGIFYKKENDETIHYRILKNKDLGTWNNINLWSSDASISEKEAKLGWAFYDDYMGKGGIALTMPDFVTEVTGSTGSDAPVEEITGDSINFFSVNIPLQAMYNILVYTLWYNGLEKNLNPKSISTSSQTDSDIEVEDEEIVDEDIEDAADGTTPAPLMTIRADYPQGVWESALSKTLTEVDLPNTLWEDKFKTYVYEKGVNEKLWTDSVQDTLWADGLQGTIWASAGADSCSDAAQGTVWAYNLKRAWYQKIFVDTIYGKTKDFVSTQWKNWGANAYDKAKDYGKVGYDYTVEYGKKVVGIGGDIVKGIGSTFGYDLVETPPTPVRPPLKPVD